MRKRKEEETGGLLPFDLRYAAMFTPTTGHAGISLNTRSKNITVTREAVMANLLIEKGD